MPAAAESEEAVAAPEAPEGAVLLPPPKWCEDEPWLEEVRLILPSEGEPGNLFADGRLACGADWSCRLFTPGCMECMGGDMCGWCIMVGIGDMGGIDGIGESGDITEDCAIRSCGYMWCCMCCCGMAYEIMPGKGARCSWPARIAESGWPSMENCDIGMT